MVFGAILVRLLAIWAQRSYNMFALDFLLNSKTLGELQRDRDVSDIQRMERRAGIKIQPVCHLSAT
jgi:hypothetical protein